MSIAERSQARRASRSGPSQGRVPARGSSASVLLVLFPVYLLFMVSFAPGAALFGDRPDLLVITDFTFRWWQRVIERRDLWRPLLKSLTVATRPRWPAIVIAAPGRLRDRSTPGRRSRYTIVLGPPGHPDVPGVHDRHLGGDAVRPLGLIDTLRGADPRPPDRGAAVHRLDPGRDLRDACRASSRRRRHIDGASRLATLLRVVFPVAAPGIAVAALFVWLYSWNEFLYARLLTTNQNTLPLQVFQAIDRGTLQQMADGGRRAHAADPAGRVLPPALPAARGPHGAVKG